MWPWSFLLFIKNEKPAQIPVLWILSFAADLKQRQHFKTLYGLIELQCTFLSIKCRIMEAHEPLNQMLIRNSNPYLWLVVMAFIYSIVSLTYWYY